MDGTEDSVFSMAKYAGSLRQFRTQSRQRLGNTSYLQIGSIGQPMDLASAPMTA
jgi:hypothetical protein